MVKIIRKWLKNQSLLKRKQGVFPVIAFQLQKPLFRIPILKSKHLPTQQKSNILGYSKWSNVALTPSAVELNRIKKELSAHPSLVEASKMKADLQRLFDKDLLKSLSED